MATFDRHFYYENQLCETATSWSLYAPKLSESKEANGTSSNVVSKSNSDYTLEDDFEEILKGIVTDTTLSISGEHLWSGSDGTKATNKIAGFVDIVKSAVNDVSSTVAIGKGIFDDLSANGSSLDSRLDKISKADGVDNSNLDAIINFAKQATQGGQFITGFDFIKVFKGTNVGISIPQLDTRLYHGVPVVGDYEDVVSEIKELNRRFIGDTKLADELGGLVGLQQPPSGYVPHFTTTGKAGEIIPGTFILRYGDIKIPNLLISGFNYRFSTLKVRECDGHDGKSNPRANIKVKNSPLYADIQVQLIPCTYISKQYIEEILTKAFDGKVENYDVSKMDFSKSRTATDQVVAPLNSVPPINSPAKKIAQDKLALNKTNNGSSKGSNNTTSVSKVPSDVEDVLMTKRGSLDSLFQDESEYDPFDYI